MLYPAALRHIPELRYIEVIREEKGNIQHSGICFSKKVA